MICTKKDLAPEWFEFAGGKSRFKLDEAKMSVDERQLFKDKNRFAAVQGQEPLRPHEPRSQAYRHAPTACQTGHHPRR
jgi:hypothetical protein